MIITVEGVLVGITKREKREWNGKEYPPDRVLQLLQTDESGRAEVISIREADGKAVYEVGKKTALSVDLRIYKDGGITMRRA